MPRRVTPFRLTEEQDRKLGEIAEMLDISRNEVVTNLIVAEYDRLKGSPELLKLVDQMKVMKEQIEKYSKGGQA